MIKFKTTFIFQRSHQISKTWKKFKVWLILLIFIMSRSILIQVMISLNSIYMSLKWTLITEKINFQMNFSNKKNTILKSKMKIRISLQNLKFYLKLRKWQSRYKSKMTSLDKCGIIRIIRLIHVKYELTYHCLVKRLITLIQNL